MQNILVIGSLNMDMVINMKRMPQIGETVLGTSIRYVPGGKGANQAYAAGRLQGNVKMLGCVGQDNFGIELTNSLEQAGVDTGSIIHCPGESTGMAVIYVNSEGNNSIVVTPGANSKCSEDYIREKENILNASDILLLQMDVPVMTVYYLINRAYELGKTIILNPAPASDEIPDEMLAKLDYITPNETELSKIMGMRRMTTGEITHAAEALVDRGVKNVIVTMGDRGAMLVNKDGAEIFPAIKAGKVVDTTAAGDCFNAAFAVALAEGKSHREAFQFANAASAIVVTRSGAQSSIPSREETETLLRS
jgi:ribokinase